MTPFLVAAIAAAANLTPVLVVHSPGLKIQGNAPQCIPATNSPRKKCGWYSVAAAKKLDAPGVTIETVPPKKSDPTTETPTHLPRSFSPKIDCWTHHLEPFRVTNERGEILFTITCP